MASKWKKQRKDLQQPDQFVNFWTKTGDILVKRAKLLLTVMITILASVIGIQISRSMQMKQGAERSQAIAKLVAIAEARLLPAEGAAPNYDDGVPHFKTDAERKAAAVAEADRLIGQHGNSALAQAVEFLKARYLVDLGRLDEALVLYRKLEASDSLPVELRLVAGEGLAYALESQGNLTQAIETLAALAARAEKAGGFFRDRALFHQARLLEKVNEPEKAKAIYRELTDRYPSSALRDEISERLAVLDVDNAGAKGADQAPTTVTP